MKRYYKELVKERAELCKKRDTLNAQIIKISKVIENINDVNSKHEISILKTEEESIKYFLEFKDTNTFYKAANLFWGELYIGGRGCFGTWGDTNQSALQIVLTYGSKESLLNTLNFVEKVLPYIRLHKDGYKWFQILEHTLSAGSSYYLLINEKNKEYIVKGSYSIQDEKNNLMDALLYIQECHWYDGKEQDRDYED